jgi:hypothetical protein
MNIKKSDMETEINVAATLKDKPQGVKLYSRICGAVELKEVLDVRKKKSIVVKELNSSNQHRFWYDGKFFRAGQCVLQPSKEMADWSKFAWKKGDVLVCKDVNSHIIFEAFNDDTYTTFTGKQNYQATRVGYSYAHTRNIAMTQDFDIEKGDAAQTYINTIEEKLGGKLNRETLEVEKQPEFKDGDILSIQEDEEHYHAILIFKGGTDVYVYFDYFHRVLTYGTKIDENEKSISHLATDEEKQQLFSALKKENKAWDADKKMFVDLKPKVEFKPFDKVLVRDNEDDIWEVSLFGYKDELYYRCDNGIPWIQCIPYDGNEHLLGTTNNVEG